MGPQKSEERLDGVRESYKRIREALTGLNDIITINFAEQDFYRQVAEDNLKALHENIVEVLKSSFIPREIRMRLRELEFDECEAKQFFPL